MDLLTYISDMDRRAKLAADTDSCPHYLWQVATGRRRASTDLAQLIETKTERCVPRELIRPDVWGAPPSAAGRSEAAA